MKRIVIVLALLIGTTGFTYAQTQSKAQKTTQSTTVAPKMDPMQKAAKKMTDDMDQYLHLTKEQYEKIMALNMNIVSMQQQTKTNPKDEHLQQQIKSQKLNGYIRILDGKRFHDYMEHNHIDPQELSNLH